jgi:hypothetical protein
MRLLAAISQHGLGHLAQAAPVLNALRALQPNLQLTIWSGLDRGALQSRIAGPFEHRADAADVGLVMRDAMRVDTSASHAAYLAFHADWPARVSREAAWLRGQAFDRVFADIAYLPLAAAAQAGIAGVAMCSLNWADIARAYLADLPGMTQILAQVHAAYAAADLFLQPLPAMPMEDLPRRRPIAPIAALGRNRRAELNRNLGLPADRKLVLLGFGGIGYQGRGGLPKVDATLWLTPDNWPAEARPDLLAYGRCGLPFLDLLASCDLLVTKVGYGSFVEANAHALPVLYVDRPDWPETPYLAGWLRQHGNAKAIDEASLFSDALGELMHSLWRQPRKPATPADGAEMAARHLLAG